MGVFSPPPHSPDPLAFETQDQSTLAAPRAGSHLEWAPYNALDLVAVLGALAPLPPYSTLVGVCEDGLPLLLDLKNPAAGSILLVGNPGTANRALIRSLLASAVLLNTAEEVQLYLVTGNGDAYGEFQEVPGSFEIISPYGETVLDLIWEFACRAQQGNCGRLGHGVQVLLIEDLETLFARLSHQGRSDLAWLVERGPQSGAWVIAGLDASRFGEMDARLLTGFRTQILEFSGAKPLGAAATEREDGARYGARIAGEFVRFWLPRYTFATEPDQRVVKGTS